MLPALSVSFADLDAIDFLSGLSWSPCGYIPFLSLQTPVLQNPFHLRSDKFLGRSSPSIAHRPITASSFLFRLLTFNLLWKEKKNVPLVLATGFSHMVYEFLCSLVYCAASLPCAAAQSTAVITVLMSIPGQAYWSVLSLLWLLPRVIICLDMTSNLRSFPQHFDNFVHCLSMLKLLMRSLLLYNLRNLFFLDRFQDSFLILMVWLFFRVSGTEFIYPVVTTKKKKKPPKNAFL